MTCTYSKADYIRHAERFGCEEVFETALHDHDLVIPADSSRPRELGAIAARLQNIDPKRRLPRSWALALAGALVRDGLNPTIACRQAGITRQTLRRHTQDPRRFGSAPSLNRAISAPEGDPSQDPVLTAKAALSAPARHDHALAA
jgi:hypothetical protein